MGTDGMGWVDSLDWTGGVHVVFGSSWTWQDLTGPGTRKEFGQSSNITGACPTACRCPLPILVWQRAHHVNGPGRWVAEMKNFRVH